MKLLRMNTKKDIPVQFKNTFKSFQEYQDYLNSFEEYKEWCIEKSKKELLKVFEKNDLDDYKNR